jgi:lysozyme
MTTSKNGLTFIKELEGTKLVVYLDSAGRPTIGTGHLIKPGESFPNGITMEENDTILVEDVKEVEKGLIYLRLNQNQYDSLVSFGFNLGLGSLKQLLSHGLDQIPVQILKWNHAGGRESKGLTARRIAEKNLYLTEGEPDILGIIEAARKESDDLA